GDDDDDEEPPPPPDPPATGIGVNLGWPEYWKGVAFRDLMKQSMVYASNDRIAAWATNFNGTPVATDANGNPQSVPAMTVFPASASVPTGQYVCTWSGSGSLPVSAPGRQIVSQQQGRIVFNMSPGSGDQFGPVRVT